MVVILLSDTHTHKELLKFFPSHSFVLYTFSLIIPIFFCSVLLMLKITLYSSQWQEPLSHIMVTEFHKKSSLFLFSIQLFFFAIIFNHSFAFFLHHCAIIFHFKNMIIFRLKFKTLELSAREMEVILFSVILFVLLCFFLYYSFIQIYIYFYLQDLVDCLDGFMKI